MCRRPPRSRSAVLVAAALAAVISHAHAQNRPDPLSKWGPSVLHQQQPSTLSPPVSGLDETKKRVRTITIRPDASPEPAPRRRYYAQLTTQRSAQEAQDRFDEMQKRFAALANREPVILRTQAGLSVIYRAVIGPFGDLSDANEMCDRVRAQGGPCLVHRIEPEE